MIMPPEKFRTRVEAGGAHLRATDPVLDGMIAREGECRLLPSRGASPYEGLVRSVAYQQLQGKAADAILARFVALFAPAPFPSPADVLAADTAALRASGLSGSKVAAIRAIAAEAAAGTIPDLAGAAVPARHRSSTTPRSGRRGTRAVAERGGPGAVLLVVPTPHSICGLP